MAVTRGMPALSHNNSNLFTRHVMQKHHAPQHGRLLHVSHTRRGRPPPVSLPTPAGSLCRLGVVVYQSALKAGGGEDTLEPLVGRV